MVAVTLGMLGAAVVGPLLARAARRWSRAQAARPPGILAVSLVTGLVFGLTAWRLGWSWQLAPVLVGAAGIVTVAAVDAACRRVPTGFVVRCGAATLATAVVASAWSGTWQPLAAAGVGAGAYGGGLTVVHLVAPSGLGGGDVRLAWLVGAVVGWASASASAAARTADVDAGFAAPALSAVWAVWAAVLLSTGIGLATHGVVALRHNRREGAPRTLPFGPALGVGALVVLLSQPT